MKRVGMTQMGRAVAYIKDGLDEIARAIDDFETRIATLENKLTKGF